LTTKFIVVKQYPILEESLTFLEVVLALSTMGSVRLDNSLMFVVGPSSFKSFEAAE